MMTVPLVGIAGGIEVGQSPGREGGIGSEQANSFVLTLGDLLGTALTTPVVVTPVAVDLELLIDGEWSPIVAEDESTEGSDNAAAEGATTAEAGPVGREGLSTPTAERPANPLRDTVVRGATPPGLHGLSESAPDEQPVEGDDTDLGDTAEAPRATTTFPGTVLLGSPSGYRSITEALGPSEFDSGPTRVELPITQEVASHGRSASIDWHTNQTNHLLTDQSIDATALLAAGAENGAVEIAGFGFPTEPGSVLAAVASPNAETRSERSNAARGGSPTDIELGKLDRPDPTLLGAIVKQWTTANKKAEPVRGPRTNEESEPSRDQAPGPAAGPIGGKSADGSNGAAPLVVQSPGSGGREVSRGKSAEPPGPVTAPEPALPVGRRDHVVVQLADETGDVGRIRVAVSGGSIRATIIPHDPALVDRLNQNLRDLKQTLEDRGFTEPLVAIQATRRLEAPQPTGREPVIDPQPTLEGRGARTTGEEARRSSSEGDHPAPRRDHQRTPDRPKPQYQEQAEDEQ